MIESPEATTLTQTPAISLVTPAFNEADNLPILYARVSAAMVAAGLTWEWIIVDDHSTDATFAALCVLGGHDHRVRGIRLARNAGSHAAILCGLAEAQGEAAIILAGDGQDPPEEIPRLIMAWSRGASIVWAEKRNQTRRSWHAELASRTFHSVLRWMSGLENMTRNGSDFFLISRRVIDTVNALGERNTNVMALLAWTGFDQTVLTYDKEERQSGQSGWTFRKKVRLFLDSIYGFGMRPLRAISMLGFLIAFFGFLYAGVVILNAILGHPTEGWSSLMVVVLVLGGAQMITLGILGEYVWRALDESRGRPRYIIERRSDEVTAKGSSYSGSFEASE